MVMGVYLGFLCLGGEVSMDFGYEVRGLVLVIW